VESGWLRQRQGAHCARADTGAVTAWPDERSVAALAVVAASLPGIVGRTIFTTVPLTTTQTTFLIIN